MSTQAISTGQKQTGNHYRIFIDQAPHAIAMFDREIRYIGASRKWRSDYGLGDRVLEGVSHYEIFPEIGDDWKRIHQACLNGAINTCDEAYFLREDGTEQWIAWDVRPWYGEKGEIGGILMFTEDITERKRSEQRVQDLLEITQKQNKRLQNFAHIVSHNLRSHSGNIESILGLLTESHPELLEEELLQMLQSASGNLSTTIRDLNEIATIHSRATKGGSPINLNKALEKALEVTHREAVRQQVKICNELPANTKVWGIPAYVESICLNLISNAIRYSSPDRNRQIHIHGGEEQHLTHLSVSDNGIGIDLERHGDDVFGMYKTFHNHPQSHGLGLFITKNQVEAMSGSITVESSVGVGTTFRVSLPNRPEK